MSKLTKEKLAMAELRFEKGFEGLGEAASQMNAATKNFNTWLKEMHAKNMRKLKAGTKRTKV